MNRYTIAQAAARLGVTRQTVYKYVNRDKNRYTLTEGGNTYVTAYGLDNLRSDIESKAARVNSTGENPPQGKQAALTELTTLRIQLEAANARAATAEEEATSLRSRLDVLTAKYEGALNLVENLRHEADKASAALEREQLLHGRTQEALSSSRSGWLKRLFGKKEQPAQEKTTQASAEGEVQ